MQNAGLNESQAEIKISEGNNNDLRYAGDTILIAENEVAQSCPTLCSSLHQAPPSMGFSRQEYWSGVPLPSP